MAFGVKRLIPTSMGARVLLPGALSLVFCPSMGICRDQRNNNAALKHGLQAETTIYLCCKQWGNPARDRRTGQVCVTHTRTK